MFIKNNKELLAMKQIYFFPQEKVKLRELMYYC